MSFPPNFGSLMHAAGGNGMAAMMSGDRPQAWNNAARLSPVEAQEYLDAPVSDAEREQLQELVAWFTRRYPSPLERLAYVRRAYARWQRSSGLASERPGASAEEVQRGTNRD